MASTADLAADVFPHMPYADPEKVRAAKRESARRRRAADPQAVREYDRTQKRRRRAVQRAGPDASEREIELQERYPTRAFRSVRMTLGKSDDLRLAIANSGRVEPWAQEEDEHLEDWDRWMPWYGFPGFRAPLSYDEEERRWLAYYRHWVTPPMQQGCHRPDGAPERRWLHEYGYDGEERARELAANLAGEGLDLRRLARYLRHHPTLTWFELGRRLNDRLPAPRLERAIHRLRRLGYLHGDWPRIH